MVVLCNCFELKTVTIKETNFGSKELYHTLSPTESGIDVGQGINVGSGEFGKNNKQNLQTYVDQKNLTWKYLQPTEKFQNLINIGSLIKTIRLGKIPTINKHLA